MPGEGSKPILDSAADSQPIIYADFAKKQEMVPVSARLALDGLPLGGGQVSANTTNSVTKSRYQKEAV